MAVVSEQRTRRIVVVFGGGSSDTGVAQVLASLVSESSADIAGVFLEDHVLFRVAALPFTTELCRITTMRRSLTTGGLECQMKVQALHAEQAVRRVAERAGSPWSFRKHRGRLSTALAEARDVDLLLIGTARGVLASVGELRATARTARAGQVESRQLIAVLVDRANTAAQALDAGIELAERTGRGVIVFLPDEGREAHPDLSRRLQLLGPKRATIRTVTSAEPGALFAAVRRAAPAVLIVGASETGFEEPRIGALQRGLRCPVVMVRRMPA
jgi:hypothetical protein